MTMRLTPPDRRSWLIDRAREANHHAYEGVVRVKGPRVFVHYYNPYGKFRIRSLSRMWKEGMRHG